MTVVYYTSNRKPKAFREKIQQIILEHKGDLPLVSVSQDPIDFGANICVGDRGTSIHNAMRQVQIGCQAATTSWVCLAEDDLLYPRSYFDFHPEQRNTFYIADPCYVCYAQRHCRHFFSCTRDGHEGAVIIDREFLIRVIERRIGRFGQWSGPKVAIHLEYGHPVERFAVDAPVVSFRTDADMHRRARYDTRHMVREIPYWGNIREVFHRFGVPFYDVTWAPEMPIQKDIVA
jgi:hypothetical protein